jgi:hypothetical protein
LLTGRPFDIPSFYFVFSTIAIFMLLTYHLGH